MTRDRMDLRHGRAAPSGRSGRVGSEGLGLLGVGVHDGDVVHGARIGVAPLGGGAPTDPGRHAGAALVARDPFNALGIHSDARGGEAADKLELLARAPRNWGEFKTPTLRNTARTAPYMHQGQMATLHDVLRYYSTLEGMVQLGHHQESILVPLKLADGELDDLVAFLESLTDVELDPTLLAAPRD